MTGSTHERDFYGWVEEQCAALREELEASTVCDTSGDWSDLGL